MKNRFFKTIPVLLTAMLLLTGCNNSDEIQNGGSSDPIVNSTSGNSENSSSSSDTSNPESSSTSETTSGNSQGDSQSSSVTGSSTSSSLSTAGSSVTPGGSSTPAPESKPKTAGTLQVSFGADGAPFTMYIYDNPTAAAIARHVGTARWQLPIYHFDDYENWEVMQYYDVPSRYEIPSDPEKVTSEKAGEVYYSEPNRIVLYFGDAKVSSEYTPVGYFDPTPEFISAVENNPVLEGWGNKLVIIQPGD